MDLEISRDTDISSIVGRVMGKIQSPKAANAEKMVYKAVAEALLHSVFRYVDQLDEKSKIMNKERRKSHDEILSLKHKLKQARQLIERYSDKLKNYKRKLQDHQRGVTKFHDSTHIPRPKSKLSSAGTETYATMRASNILAAALPDDRSMQLHSSDDLQSGSAAETVNDATTATQQLGAETLELMTTGESQKCVPQNELEVAKATIAASKKEQDKIRSGTASRTAKGAVTAAQQSEGGKAALVGQADMQTSILNKLEPDKAVIATSVKEEEIRSESAVKILKATGAAAQQSKAQKARLMKEAEAQKRAQIQIISKIEKELERVETALHMQRCVSYNEMPLDAVQWA